MEDRIFLIYNYWEWKPRAVLSLLIRMVTCGPNHCAFYKNGVVHEMVGSEITWVIKRLLGKPVSYAANEGCGYKTSTYEEWANHADRHVIELVPDKPLVIPALTEGYGFFDLIQILFQVVRTKWFLGGNRWNGTDGTRIWHGVICSELIQMARQKAECWGVLPIDLLIDRGLNVVQEFETKKAA